MASSDSIPHPASGSSGTGGSSGIPGPAVVGSSTYDRGTASGGSSAPPPFPGAPRGPQFDHDDPAASGAAGFSPEDSLQEQIDDLERWVQANQRRERQDALRFWLLRVPALTCAMLAAIAGPLGLSAGEGAVLAATLALLIVIDAAWPSSSLQNPLTRALHDLRELQNTAKLRWDRVRLAYPEPEHPKRTAHALALLDAIQNERRDISKYLAGFVASPSVGRRLW